MKEDSNECYLRRGAPGYRKQNDDAKLDEERCRFEREACPDFEGYADLELEEEKNQDAQSRLLDDDQYGPLDGLI